MSSFERSRGKRSNLNFERTARAFDESAVPAHNLAAKKEVKAAKRPDLLLAGRPGWNQSTLSENMKRFPDRPLCRQNFKYDAPKRADYNFRAEVLEHADRAMYMPRESKFEYSERRVTAPGLQLANPPPLSRVEFPNHPELARATASGEKKRWDGATGAGGDPVQKDFVDPSVTVHVTTGNGGPPRADTFNESCPGPSCGKIPATRHQSVNFGYGRVTAFNATHLRYVQINNKDDSIEDFFFVTQSHHGPFKNYTKTRKTLPKISYD